jgi:hypothetical protein
MVKPFVDPKYASADAQEDKRFVSDLVFSG